MTRTRNQTASLLACMIATIPVSVALGDEPITGPYADRVMIFMADTPDALSAIGTRTLAGHPKSGGIEQVERWELSSTVFVKTASIESIVGVLQEDQGLIAPDGATALTGLPAGVSVEVFGAVPGWFVVRAPSVRIAAELSMELLAAGVFESVELSAIPEKVLRNNGGPTGPLLDQQWHLNNSADPLFDVNAQAAWDLGFSGAGVNVGIIEGSFQWDDPIDFKDSNHPDLEANMNFNIMTAPSFFESDHATAVAGIIAANGDNNIGGAGIAYNAGIASQVYGDLETTITAFTYKIGQTHLKNNSWGVEDAGYLIYLPDVLADALEYTSVNGRGQRGSVIVWAGGNGGTDGNDRADYDPWVGNKYVVGIGAIGDDDKAAWYTERGSNIFMVAPSDGGSRGITTTDMTGEDGYAPGSYTNTFGGTSAAAPLAAGVMALAFEANPELTRRDLLHVMADTARRNDPTDNSWTTNGSGRWISEKYGFGALDAGALVIAAETHLPVRPESSLSSGRLSYGVALPDNNPTGVTVEFTMPRGLMIEQAQMVIDLSSTYVGDIAIVLTSPSGTSSKLMHTRVDSAQGIFDFPFKSYHFWGEDSGGVWTMHLADQGIADLATLNELEFTVFGIRCAPDVNFDGVVDTGDIYTFVSAFLDQDLEADFNGDGLIDSGDVHTFVAAFLEGC